MKKKNKQANRQANKQTKSQESLAATGDSKSIDVSLWFLK